jgi:high-affinity nickel permease
MRPQSWCAFCATANNPPFAATRGVRAQPFSGMLQMQRISLAKTMTSGLAILAIGFFLGMRHATDPDHVIAVSTIVSRERSIAKAAFIGVLWGLGHTLTILAVGAAIILFGLAIPARIGLTMEFCVGLMLILLGVLNLTGTMKWMSEKFSPAHPPIAGEHAHIHEHGAKMHFHWHSHAPQSDHHGKSLAPPPVLERSFAGLGLYQSLRPLFVGIVHGLAGSAAVALLVLSAIREPKWAVLYLLVFGLGTIAGMMLITSVIALPFSFAGYRFAWLNRSLITASGILSLAFGLFVCYHIGFVDGLFTAHPNWNPS